MHIRFRQILRFALSGAVLAVPGCDDDGGGANTGDSGTTGDTTGGTGSGAGTSSSGASGTTTTGTGSATAGTTTSSSTASTSGQTTGTDTGNGTDTGTDTGDAYPAERGFEFDGAWYPEASMIAPCGNNGNISTYQVGTREGTGEQAIAAWLFATGDGVIPAPGNYTVSAYDGATGPMEADFVLTDLRDNSQYLSNAVSGTLTVYDAGAGAIDVVWHNVGLATVPGLINSSAEGWVTCTY